MWIFYYVDYTTIISAFTWDDRKKSIQSMVICCYFSPSKQQLEGYNSRTFNKEDIRPMYRLSLIEWNKFISKWRVEKVRSFIPLLRLNVKSEMRNAEKDE